MRVFIANFGRGNYAWPECKRRHSVATMNDADMHHYWLHNDRAGYIAYSAKHRKTARGNPVPAFLASKWFNLMTTICETSSDIWIHRDGDELWWTESLALAAEIDATPKSVPYQTLGVYECHKPCLPWSNRDKSGGHLAWSYLHPKAKDFLSTEATFQKLSPEYAAYAKALVDGTDLSRWHELPKWKSKLGKASTHRDGLQGFVDKSIAEMARQAQQTSSQSNGQVVERAVKSKDFSFANLQELESYLRELLKAQKGQCAISKLPLQYHGSHDDPQMLCSLDRIESSAHYARGNLQIVCRFINRWKSDMDDAEFRRLLGILR